MGESRGKRIEKGGGEGLRWFYGEKNEERLIYMCRRW